MKQRLSLVLAATILGGCDTNGGGIDGHVTPLIELNQAPFTFPSSFSSVVALKSLSDCRVVVADRRERVVKILNMADLTLDTLGRMGPGPGEYANLDGLLTTGDTVLVLDSRSLRIQPYSLNDGAAGEAITLPSEFFGSQIRAVDNTGNIYMSGNTLHGNPVNVLGRDRIAIPIFRHNLRTGEADTIATLFIAPTVNVTMVRRDEGYVRRDNLMIARPFGFTDAWAISSDGDLRIVRSDPYQLETGGGETFSPLSYEPVRVTDADKVRGHAQIEFDWPTVKEPFVASSILTGPNDETWVRREMPATEPYALYDVLDAQGQREMQVSVPANSVIRDVDSAFVYAVRQDEVDLLWLDVYPRKLLDGRPVDESITSCLSVQ